jgi:hypothetical protein
MPNDKQQSDRVAADPYEALDTAMRDVSTVNEALLAASAANLAQSRADLRAASRLLLGVLHDSLMTALQAVEQVQEATSG